MRKIYIFIFCLACGTLWYIATSGRFHDRNAVVQESPDLISSSEVNSNENESNPKDDVDINSLVDSSQDDPRIIDFIRYDGSFLIPPSQESYNLKKPDDDPSMGQGQFIRKLFNTTPGFFVECGALDGETRSNTLYLEKNLGWQGLLIEANPDNFNLLVEKHRKAWASKSCLATKPHPHHVKFEKNFNVGKIVKDEVSSDEMNKQKAKSKVVIAQCFPMFSLLSAMNVSTVDYFSLDVEGAEFKVLNNIPFDKIFIKTLSVEFSHVPEGKKTMMDFMDSKGYDIVKNVTNPRGLANDFIFLHRSLSSLMDY